MSTDLSRKYGPWALVTGASAGIGEAFARRLAGQGFNVALVARSGETLARIAAELRAAHGVEARAIACDLGREDFMDSLLPAIEGLDIGLLVNNAGFCNTGAVVDNALEDELRLLHVNCRAVLVLSHHFGRALKAQGRGGIVIVSSVVSFIPNPFWANYSASKAYDRFLGEALYHELRPHGVDVVTVCPGATRTKFEEVANIRYGKNENKPEAFVLEPAQVAETALRGLGRRPVIVAGWWNRAYLRLTALVPGRIRSAVMGQVVKGLRENARRG